MKYLKSLSLVLCITLLTMTGCSLKKGGDTQNTIETPKISVEATNEKETQAPKKAPSETVKPEQTTKPEKTPITANTSNEDMDFFDKLGVGKLPDEVELPDCAEKTDIDYLYRLNIDLGKARNLSSLSLCKDTIFCNDPMVGVDYLFDYNSGQQLAKIEEQGDYLMTGRLADGGFWTVCPGNLEATLYSKNGKTNVVRKKQKKGCDSFCYITCDGKYELYDNENGEILAYDFSTGQANVCYEGSRYYSFDAETKEGYIIGLSNGNYINVQPDKAISTLIYDRNKDSSDDDYSAMWPFLKVENEKQVTLVPMNDTGVSVSLTKKEDAEYVMGFDLGVLVTSTSTKPFTINFYDLRAKQQIGSIISPNNAEFGVARILDNGMALLSCVTNNKTELYLYDLVSKRSASQCSVTFKERKEKVETNPVIKKLNEKYGVTIYYGEDCTLPECDKIASPLKDQKKIETSIKAVKKFLEMLPEGMTQEMYQDTGRGLSIYLAGNIKDTSGLLTAVGGYCMTANSGRIIVVINCNDNINGIVETLAHEFSHAFESRISYVSGLTGVDWLQEWENLLPSKIKNPYKFTYASTSSQMEYTPYGTKKDIWFVDDYARTFSTEDRARMFEYMFTPEDGKLNYRLEYKNLKYKARFYALMIRSCFESCKNEEDLIWESYLGDISKKEFSDVLQ